MKKFFFFLVFAIPIFAIFIVKLTATVTVGDIFISVDSITLNKTYIDARVGDSVDLSYIIYPEIATNKEVIWSSNAEQTAVVDANGHVEFVGIGSGYITAATKEGNHQSHCYFYVGDSVVHRLQISAPQKNRVHVNKTLQLTTTVVPNEAVNKEVTYSSSNNQIATVDSNGLVRGLKVGNVTITATALDNGITETIDLSVINPVTSLNIEKTEIVTANKTARIEYVIEPADATITNVFFEIDHPEIAQIDDRGEITFNKPGEANITLITDDGEFKKTINCVYTNGHVNDIVLENPRITMQINSAPIYFEFKTLPENLYGMVSVVSDNENVAYVDSSNYLHAVKGGNTIIRLRATTYKNEEIEKQVYVYVMSPATAIEIDDAVTAENSFQLVPTSLPEGSTNNNYYYHIKQGNATVTETGLVNFNEQTPCTVTVTIYANEDYGTVTKDVQILYTAGMASSFELADKQLTLNYGDTASLSYNITPANATIRPLTLNIENNNVLEVLPDGRIHAIAGGQAKVEVSFTLFNNSVVKDYCLVTVNRAPEQININLNLDFYKNQYISPEKQVEFSALVLPLDATDKQITWSVNDSNIAFINNNKLIFNQVGYVKLIATVGKISSEVEIYYVGTNAIYAELSAEYNNTLGAVPEQIMVGESFNVQISKIIPQYLNLSQLSMQIINQKTSNPSKQVLKVNGNSVTGVAGGTATLVVYVSSFVRLNFTITVVRLPEEITVMQANTQVSANVVNLIGEVLPYDTTNKNIYYIVKETDIASIEGSTLTFKTNGMVNITAVADGNENVKLTFYIEKIEKDTIHAALNQTSVSLNVGDLLVFDYSGQIELNINNVNPSIANGAVIKIENDRYIRAISSGTAQVTITAQNTSYTLDVTVNQLVENITPAGNIDYYAGEYVVGADTVDLNFEIYPRYATNKEISVSIIQSVASNGQTEKIASIVNQKISFIKAGVVALEVKSNDGNFTSVFHLRYTGGVALDAQLNVGNMIVMDIGDSVSIGVSSWLPHDVVDSRILIKEVVNVSGKKVIEVNANTRTITAVDSGEAKLVMLLSNNIIKEVEILCINRVKDVKIDADILTASSSFTLNAEVVPNEATNKVLEYVLEKTDIATINNNVITFLKAGSVKVFVRTTDGSNIEKQVNVTSTMGYLSKLVLTNNNLTINKGETVWLYVDKYPQEATHNEINFKIISQQSYDGQSSPITLKSDGQIVALCAGTAVVRVYAYDYYGQEIYTDCNIKVFSPLAAFSINFETKIDNYQNKNTFITSKNELIFNLVYEPIDAEVSSYSYLISNPSLAQIDGNKISFLKEGSEVSISFTCFYGNMQKTNSYTFYFVGNSLFEAELDKTNFENNIINLKAGQNMAFSLKSYLPSDNNNITFTISDANETRNDANKQVANFAGGVLYALNGGSYTFSLWANGYKLEDNLCLIVTRDADRIELSGPDEVYISEPYYTILAHVMETDASQTLLGFKSNNTSVATVSQNGDVEFSRLGSCDITIYVVEKPEVKKIVSITYTKELKQIVFNETRDSLFVGDAIDLTITPVPLDAAEFEYTLDIDNKALATIENKGQFYHLIAKSAGQLTITATAILPGKDVSITATKTINIYTRISEIALDLNKQKEKGGQGQYRLFGNSFYNSANQLINSYTMGVTLTPANSPKDLLVWYSNNEDVATVDKKLGIVTFLKPGKVTITVKQDVPDGLVGASASYQFNVVEGINVENYAQFKLAALSLTNTNANRTDNYAAMVLQNSISIGSDMPTVNFAYNLYGNAFILDHSSVSTTGYHYYVNKNNVVLDNVVLRGKNIKDKLELQNSGIVLSINYCSNVLVYNCIIEYAETGIQIVCATAQIEGCILQNNLVAGIKIARYNNLNCTVTVTDSIFAGSFIGILFWPNVAQPGPDNVLKLNGDVWFYNWSTTKQLERGLDLERLLREHGLAFASNQIFEQLEKIALNKGTNYAYKDSATNEIYYNFGVVNLFAELPNIMTINGAGKLDISGLTGNCTRYQYVTIEDSLFLGVAVPIKLSILTIPNSQMFIHPNDNYTDNTQLLAKIKKPCRI